MPATKVTDDEVFQNIAEVFRTYGYEGASIRLLSEATGLERASLYHRFPNGKEGMAVAVIAHTGAWFHEHVFLPLRGASSGRAGRPTAARAARGS